MNCGKARDLIRHGIALSAIAGHQSSATTPNSRNAPTCRKEREERKSNERRDYRKEGDAPFAIGSHRSVSLTSTSYPVPCACAS
jgi:hypothetical protein